MYVNLSIIFKFKGILFSIVSFYSSALLPITIVAELVGSIG